MGVHARETWKNAVSVGGGYVETGRRDAAQPNYRLWGADLTLRHGRRTRLEAEIAKSESLNAASLFSRDGGLTFQPFHRRDGTGGDGMAMLIRGGFELADVMDTPAKERWYSEGYWQYMAPGFSSGGTIQQQGLEKYGGLSRYLFDGGHFVHLRHDGWKAKEPESQSLGVVPAFEQQVTRFGYGYHTGPLKLDSEFVYTQSDQGPEAPVMRVGTIVIGGEYTFAQRWTAIAQQELVLQGDSRIHNGTSDLLATTAGLRYQAAKTLYVEGLETVRWSGDNATQIGLRTEINERHTVYAQERFVDDNAGRRATTVIGGEERWGADKSGRTYGEYQLETGDAGTQNRTVVGMGKRTRLTSSLAIDASYERSQVTSDIPGAMSRDALSTGFGWTPRKSIKLVGRYELRYEDNDEELELRDRYQFLTLNSLRLVIHRDFTIGMQFNYSHTYDLEVDGTEAELLEGSIGVAYRPVDATWLVVLSKYTKRYEQHPISTGLELPSREETDVVSLTPIF